MRPGQYSPQRLGYTPESRESLPLDTRLAMGVRGGQSTPSLCRTCSPKQQFIQNQHAASNLAKRWDRTGIILENYDHDKYFVKLDGSGRVTHRNRRFLRSFKPVMLTYLLPGTRPDACLSSPPGSSPPVVTSTHGACQVQDDDKEHDDHVQDDAPVVQDDIPEPQPSTPVSLLPRSLVRRVRGSLSPPLMSLPSPSQSPTLSQFTSPPTP